MTHPLFEVVTTSAGAVSIRNKALNEIMHNQVGPWAEANALYIDQSRLRERLLQVESDELILFDVGLGAAANALAVLHCCKQIEAPTRKLRLVSFEKDLDLLRFALAHASAFAHFTGYVDILESLLRNGTWSDGKIFWQLHKGDFLETVEREAARPHLVFFDPYSPKVNREMWSVACFEKLRRLSREADQEATTLYTYSQSTPVRVALLLAGFYVGQGRATGLKEETTQATTHFQELERPLGPVWFERWRKSHTQYPYEAPPERHAEIAAFVSRHKQFRPAPA